MVITSEETSQKFHTINNFVPTGETLILKYMESRVAQVRTFHQEKT